MASINRIWTIARNTLTEALRQKVLMILLLFGLVAIASSFLFTELTMEEQFKFLKDFSLGAMTVFGVLIALLGTAQLLPNEVESRTIYTILARPVRRGELLIGKYIGILALLFITIALMAGVFVGVLLFKEQSMIAAEQASLPADAPPALVERVNEVVAQIQIEARDPRLFQAFLLVYAKLAITAAVALLVSTFATSMIFTVSTTFLIYIIAHLQNIARQEWLENAATESIFSVIFLGLVAILIPDLSGYTVIDEIISGNDVPWSYTLNLLFYTFIYIVVVLAISSLIFGEREL